METKTKEKKIVLESHKNGAKLIPVFYRDGVYSVWENLKQMKNALSSTIICDKTGSSKPVIYKSVGENQSKVVVCVGDYIIRSFLERDGSVGISVFKVEAFTEFSDVYYAKVKLVLRKDSTQTFENKVEWKKWNPIIGGVLMSAIEFSVNKLKNTELIFSE